MNTDNIAKAKVLIDLCQRQIAVLTEIQKEKKQDEWFTYIRCKSMIQVNESQIIFFTALIEKWIKEQEKLNELIIVVDKFISLSESQKILTDIENKMKSE